MRSNTLDTAQRVQTSASRATLREADDKHLWQQAKSLDVMKSETHTDVERAQSYGFTNVPAKQDQDDQQQQPNPQFDAPAANGGGGAGNTPGDVGQQPQGDAAEAIVLYINGSRSHPVIIAIDDRRHRLKELEEGDTAQYRLKDDRQQLLMHKDGTYLSTRDDKVLRIALVPKSQSQQQQQQQGARGAQPQQQTQQKELGQKSARDDNLKSEVYMEQQGQVQTQRHGEYYAAQRGGSDTSTYHNDRKHSTQVTDQHAHIRFEDFRVWVDDTGCYSDVPIITKKDPHCKV
jgi:phage gp45-like